MALRSLGKINVVTPGTLVRATANQSDPAARVAAHGFFIQRQDGAETGSVFIGNSVMVAATLVGVYAKLGVPSTSVLPSFTSTIVPSPAGFNMADIWLDGSIANQSVLISYLEQ